MRTGFTLVEILIALVLFQIGMLALAATTMLAVRDVGAAHRRELARRAAENRVAIVRTSACDAPAAGTAEGPGIRESWRVIATGSVRLVTDSVEMIFPGRRDTLVATAWVYCGP